MLNKKKLILNAGSSIAQIFVSGIALFILYKYLLIIIGAETLGIWALVLSASSLVQFANLGITGSIVKHIADYDAVGDRDKMSLAVQTAVFSIGALSIAIIAAIFPLAHYYFEFALEPDDYANAVEILPIALLCFWLSMITSVYQGALYGRHLIAERNYVLMLDSVLHLILCLALASEYGLIGLAFARAFQNIISLLLTVMLLKRSLQELPVFPLRWSKKLFKEMFNYAINFQVITLLVMLFDPITKGFLSRYTSVSVVSYYEMANKLIQLVRSIVVSVNNVLVPSFAKLQQTDQKKAQELYSKSYKVVFYLAFSIFGFVIAGSPLTSFLWIGKFEEAFVLSMVFLSVGWLINTISVPTYFYGMGTGNMKLNVLSHVVMTLSNIALILLIGQIMDGMGVILVSSLAIGLGGVVLNIMYFKTEGLMMSELVPKQSRTLLVSFILGLVVSYFIYLLEMQLSGTFSTIFHISKIWSEVIALCLIIVGYVAVMFVPMWRHPIRKSIFSFIIG